METKKRARVIAFYLPQFHPIPENDEWWGKGFTEWTNVGKAKPLFRGHYQPRVPADLGYYDLRMPEVREAQAQMAREAGIEGFCYWHYWFGNGKRLLERPFKEVLTSGKPDFPFCLAWANHSWTNTSWKVGTRKTESKTLIEQTYPGEDEHIQHFYYLLDAFTDSRYIHIDGKPVFTIYEPLDIPNVKAFIELWNNLAIKNGLGGIHFIGIASNLSGFTFDEKGNKKYYLVKATESSIPRYNQILNSGFDAVNSRGLFRAELLSRNSFYKYYLKFLKNILKINFVEKYNYKDIIKHLYVVEDKWPNVYPTLLPNWDRSARSGKNAIIYYNSTPELFRESIKSAIEIIQDKPDPKKVLFLMSWNEWAEGNYIEPDLLFGKAYLEVLKEMISK